MIVAFLQNQWLHDPERFKQKIARYEAQEPGLGEDLRLRMIHYALFAGCLTGRRIKEAFGEFLCEEILWEETTREIADNPKTIFPAQPEHIAAVLEKYKPEVVLTFGKIARKAVSPLWKGRMVCAPHPAARQPNTVAKLIVAANELQQALKPLLL